MKSSPGIAKHITPLYQRSALVFLICTAFFCTHAYSQAKNSIGAGLALNASKEGSGYGGVLQGEIKLAKEFSMVPSVGIETPYTGYFGLGGKYYIEPGFYIRLGALAYLGGEEGSDNGIGATASGGYELISEQRSILDLNLHGDFIRINHQATPIVGIRLTYNFSFSKQGRIQ